MKVAHALLGALIMFAWSPARADLIPPEEQVCTSKAPGDSCNVTDGNLAPACGDGGECECADASCSRIQYVCPDAADDAANPGCQPNGTVTFGCLKCAPAPVQPPPMDAGEPDGGGPPAPPGHGTGCSYGGYDVAVRGVGPWMLAAAVALAVGRRRRRG